MVGLIGTIVRRDVTSSPVNPNLVDQLHRLEQAAGFSMVAFDADDDLSGQPGFRGKAEVANDGAGIAHRVASLIDECTSAVTSYLRPAI